MSRFNSARARLVLVIKRIALGGARLISRQPVLLWIIRRVIFRLPGMDRAIRSLLSTTPTMPARPVILMSSVEQSLYRAIKGDEQ